MGWGRRDESTDAGSAKTCPITLVLAGVLVTTAMQGPGVMTAQADDLPKVPASEKALSGHAVKMTKRKRESTPRLPPQAPTHAWSKAATATLTLPAGGAPKAQQAGDLPISLGSPTIAKPKAEKSGR